MHIRKFDFDYGRRTLMHKAAAGAGYAGVLTSLWPMLTKAQTPDISKAYPDELLSIEAHTRGKVKPGDLITADNIEHVEHLLEPIAVHQVKHDGRRIRIVEAETDVSRLYQEGWLETTLKNLGKAVWAKNGNLLMKPDGGPWTGGTPFVEATNGREAFMNISLSWGRHGCLQYAIKSYNVGPGGDIDYKYDLIWSELNVASRPDNTIWQGQTEKLRYNTVAFTAPQEQAGTSFLSVWPYDQRQYPELVGYIPAFKRVREYPANQRFEPLVPGLSLYLSDVYAAGDPMLTWGDFKIVERKPMLGPAPDWRPNHDNWSREDLRHGGPKGNTYWEMKYWMIPETLVVEAKPTGYPRSPVLKKRVWLGARNMLLSSYNTFDRKGDLWKNLEPSFGLMEATDGDQVMKDPTTNGQTAWLWNCLQCYDIQARRMSQMNSGKEIAGGYQLKLGHGDEAYNKYLTRQALRRLGG